MLTKEEAETAREFIELSTGRKWRRNGATQTWKRSPERFRTPVKFGLYGYGQLTELNAADFAVLASCECGYHGPKQDHASPGPCKWVS